MDENLTMSSILDKPLTYLASPYMDDSVAIREQRYDAAVETTVALLKRGRYVFSPIVFCHPMALQYDLPKDSNFWVDYNKAMIAGCGELYVLCINGIDTSVGVNREIIMAETLGVPMLFIEQPDVKGKIPFISPRKARVTWGVKI